MRVWERHSRRRARVQVACEVRNSRDVQAVQVMSRHMSNLGCVCNPRFSWVFFFMSNQIQYSVEKKENVFDI